MHLFEHTDYRAWWGRWNDTSRIADSSRTWAGLSGLYLDSAARLGRSLRVPMLVGESLPGRPDLVRSAGLVSPEALDWRTSVSRELQWTTRDSGADLWLDDIELAGVSISDFLQPLDRP